MHDDSLRGRAERLGISCADLQPELTHARVIETLTHTVLRDSGRPRGRGRPNKLYEQLQRAYFLEPFRMEKFAGRYWAKQAIQKLPRKLRPDQNQHSQNSPYKAVLSDHGKWRNQTRTDDRQWRKKLKKEWQQFRATLDDHTHNLVLSLVTLLRTMHEAYRNDEDVSISIWKNWLAICERALPPDTFVRFVEIGTPPSIRQLIAGYALIERKPYERK